MYTQTSNPLYGARNQHDSRYSPYSSRLRYQYKGDVKLGRTVKILGVARPTIGNYTGTDSARPYPVPDLSVILRSSRVVLNFIVDEVDSPGSVDCWRRDGGEHPRNGRGATPISPRLP
jgi:hypothetical protein